MTKTHIVQIGKSTFAIYYGPQLETGEHINAVRWSKWDTFCVRYKWSEQEKNYKVIKSHGLALTTDIIHLPTYVQQAMFDIQNT